MPLSIHMVMRFHSVLLVALLAILFLGCVSNSSPPTNTSTAPPSTDREDLDAYIDSLPDPITTSGPGGLLQVCGNGDEGEECFEDALETCGRATASFWSTSDGQVLDFESAGLDIASLAEGKELCKVRVYVSADSESAFAGTSATCLLEKNESGIYDVYAIGPDYCTGSYVDQINRAAAANAVPVAVSSSPTAKSFTLTANDDGFFDASNARVTEIKVNQGDKVNLIFNSSTTNNSFGGQAIKTVGVDLFSYTNVRAGQQQVVPEFTATESFTVENWWPSFQVKKGSFRLTVE